MGMFDTIEVNYPLPPGYGEYQDELFQTKDFDNGMDKYELTAHGKLIRYYYDYEVVPDEERPYYGTDKWDDSLFQMVGSLRAVPAGQATLEITKEVCFYTWDEEKQSLITFRAKMVDGKLQSLSIVEC